MSEIREGRGGALTYFHFVSCSGLIWLGFEPNQCSATVFQANFLRSHFEPNHTIHKDSFQILLLDLQQLFTMSHVPSSPHQWVAAHQLLTTALTRTFLTVWWQGKWGARSTSPSASFPILRSLIHAPLHSCIVRCAHQTCGCSSQLWSAGGFVLWPFSSACSTAVSTIWLTRCVPSLGAPTRNSTSCVLTKLTWNANVSVVTIAYPDARDVCRGFWQYQIISLQTGHKACARSDLA